jgi:REP element-mobilizing transposase RayT
MWYEMPKHFLSISLDEFVVMPNHIHGIIIIEPATPVRTLHATSQQQTATSQQQTATSQQQTATSQQQTATRPVGTLQATSLQSTKNEFMSIISPKPGSLPTVIRSYKSAVSKHIHLIDHDFSWQPRYYDHLIRSDPELDRIRKYIIDNPVKWNNP